MIRLDDYSDSYTLIKGTITLKNKAAQDQPNNATNKRRYLKTACHLLTV